MHAYRYLRLLHHRCRRGPCPIVVQPLLQLLPDPCLWNSLQWQLMWSGAGSLAPLSAEHSAASGSLMPLLATLGIKPGCHLQLLHQAGRRVVVQSVENG